MIHFNWPDERPWLHPIDDPIPVSFTHNPDLVDCGDCLTKLDKMSKAKRPETI